ncbi:MAG: diaminopimelate decarboxylase [Alphaproteobacteria bacterium]|nr:diaminopimelate decarboxylase [Alphaproteobacteria bacterium]
MSHFAHRSGVLHAEDVAIPQIAAAVGTPFYCYASASLEEQYRHFSEAMPKGALIAYAVKANGNLAVIRTLARSGAGADVVSAGEFKRALAAGIAAQKIVFSGVGKTRPEMAFALDAGLYQFNVESESELEALNEVALSKGAVAPIALRVNPDVDAKTHAKISTGKAENKFGIAWTQVRDVYARAKSLAGVKVVGVAVHIGSQIIELDPFRAAFARVAELVRQLRADGHALTRVDFGGGLGVPYESGDAPPRVRDYGDMVREAVRHLDVELILEPGRFLTAPAGILVTQVLYLKEGEKRRFAIVDAGMNDLMRPALYDAWHELIRVQEPAPGAARLPYDVVGPVCESTDLFARDRELAELKAGDLLAFLTAGAYGAVLASGYNARPPAPEILVKGGQFAVVHPRKTVEAMMADEKMPSWLG